ncbi:hypothetical protein M0805_009762 [Coniferiporia weirii]|nr:hypothetical protein M0805_009762 [Coniferiporia weirii]
MDKCSAELIALIIEYACANDLGTTARRLGLVSKYFRAIAEPLEFRALVIAGPERLKTTFSRLERARTVLSTESKSGWDRVGVRHLFICEYNAEHTLGLDAPDNDLGRLEFGLRTLYVDHATEYWKLVNTLLLGVSETLVTLTVLQITPGTGRRACASLSGVHLPRLKYLTFKQTPKPFDYAMAENPFASTTAPSLQKLYVIAPLFIPSMHGLHAASAHLRPHPLLVDMHSRFGALTHLVICGGGVRDIEVLLKIICGFVNDDTESVSACIASRRLPGRLVSAIFKWGRMPKFLLGTMVQEYNQRTNDFNNAIKDLCIDGLDVHPPTPRHPVKGESEFEVLLAEWEETALGR